MPEPYEMRAKPTYERTAVLFALIELQTDTHACLIDPDTFIPDLMQFVKSRVDREKSTRANVSIDMRRLYSDVDRELGSRRLYKEIPGGIG